MFILFEVVVGVEGIAKDDGNKEAILKNIK